MLTGTEVKSLRQGRASLIDAYAAVQDGEIWMFGAHIPEYTEGTWNNHTPRRARKLLLHKAQILKIHNKVKEGGYTIVPLQIYFSDGRAKVEIAVAKGKLAALAAVTEFMNEAKRNGTVRKALDAAGYEVPVAPLTQ